MCLYGYIVDITEIKQMWVKRVKTTRTIWKQKLLSQQLLVMDSIKSVMVAAQIKTKNKIFTSKCKEKNSGCKNRW